MIKVSQAQQKLQASVECRQKTELIEVSNALGRIVSNDILSDIMIPQTDNSAMDGFAIHADCFSEDKNTFTVSQRICAGEIGNSLRSGTAARIFTGASIPEGANAVVMQENCQYSLNENVVTIKQNVFEGMNIRRAGEDIHSGAVVLMKSIGCEVIDLGIVEDSLESTIDALKYAADQADLVMTSGGVSVGEEDHIRKALEQLGQLSMWRVNIKPGKPFVYGEITGKEKSVPFIGLPGNPVSVFVTYCIFAYPYILKMQGIKNIEIKSYQVPSGFDLKANKNRNEYVRVRMEMNDVGQSSLCLFPHQGSGVLSSASWANGLAFIPVNKAIEIGDMLEFTPFSEFSLD